MLNRILLVTVMTALPALAMQPQTSTNEDAMLREAMGQSEETQKAEELKRQAENRHIIDYKALKAQNTSDEEIAKIHHEEDARLQKIISGLYQANATLSLKAPEEAADKKVIKEILDRYSKYQSDNSESWSQTFY
ncbi:hypothetical protein [Candidatus Paracaedibacter symbiosus]|uniref:hypothetical protein n=1 Tax=Candidatus Paracaedibacter symbiosus TaxID=244582 RepID=UPI00050952ED|nr:hypothetical protein [Candidatus Paracaedibacter symbiosus]